MLFHTLKFLVLIIIAVLQLIFVRDAFLNYISYIVLIGSMFLMFASIATPERRY